jgi:crotonobetainyl-CoA:carnitine CoA-transferase CaiB-like acyl-CoA transferase
MRQPLEGIRVLEWGMFHAGPAGTAILGDLGAEVIKIEQPGIGDLSRTSSRIGSVFLAKTQGLNLFHEAANRNKKGITLDLSKEQGREAAYRLVGKSDVFLCNLRRQTIEGMKMTYPILSSYNPKLIYARVSAFGPKGPDRDRGGFDYQGQGRSGMMYSMGEEGMPPIASQFGIMDQATAIMASHQIITALLMRERFGVGQEVHVSVLSSSLYLLYLNQMFALVGDFEAPRHQRAKEEATRNHYKAQDGRWLIITANPNGMSWKPLCEALGQPELADDLRFATPEARFANREELVALFDQIFATRPRDEWLRIFAQYDLISAPVNRLSELASDPQIVENDYIVDFNHPVLGKVKIPGYPIHFSESWAGTRSAAPKLGEHTEQVLMEIGGYTAQEVANLRKEGVI